MLQKMCFFVLNQVLYTQCLNFNISVSIEANNLKFSEGVANIYMLEKSSKNNNLGPSSHFMK